MKVITTSSYQTESEVQKNVENSAESKISHTEQSYHTHYRDQPYIFIKSARSYVRLDFADIYYIKAVGSYCLIVTTDHEYTVATNLKNFLEQTPRAGLVRCHRSYAVNVDNINSFDDVGISIYTTHRTIEIPTSNSYRKELLNHLPKLRSQ